jgi:ABC-type sulfate transport system permease component
MLLMLSDLLLLLLLPLLLLLLLLLLQMVKHCPKQFSIEFKCYDQSSKVVSSSDSSVSYAAAVVTAVDDS